MELIIFTVLGGFLATALSGIVGNRADAAVTATFKTIVERIKKGGKPVNHDLGRAVIRSFIFGLKSICYECLNELKTKKKENAKEIHWLKEKNASLERRLNKVGNADYFPPTILGFNEMESLLTPNGTLSEEHMNSMRNKLIKAAIVEDDVPLCYREKIAQDLFERMSAYFADQIKRNEVVRNIFEGQLLAHIDVELQGQRITVERIEASLFDIAKGIVEVIVTVKDEAENTRQHDSAEHERTRERFESSLQIELERLRQEVIKRGQRRRELKRELVVGLCPADVRETFKDRVEILAELRKLLGDQTVKLIVIVGRGGIGKTALLSKVFQEIERGELNLTDESSAMGADGIVYVSCRGTTDKPGIERLYTDVARMLGSPHAEELLEFWKNGNISLDNKMQFLLSRLRDGCYLLVLDNLEDILTPDNTLEDSDLKTFVDLCLTTSHGLRLVATSRERLVAGSTGVHGARLLPLESGLPEDHAIDLLRDLDPTGELGLKEAPEELLRVVAQQTFGFPRALETIAGLLQDDPTLDLNELLMDTSLFNAQVVENLVAEHYRRLSNEGQLVLQALSVFNKPVPSAAVQFLLIHFYPTLDVDSVLRTLVRNYFVTHNRRYYDFELHPLDQQYAHSCIPDEGGKYNKQALHKRAGDFYIELRKPTSEWKDLEDLQPQLDEFDQRLKSKEYDRACRLLDTINYYLSQWGYYSLIRILRISLEGLLTDPYLQICNLQGLGCAQHLLGENYNAIRCFEKQLEIAEKEKAKVRIIHALNGLAHSNLDLGEYSKCLPLTNRALKIAKEIGDRSEERGCLGIIGSTYGNLGDFQKALEYYEKALTIFTEDQNQFREDWCLANFGLLKSELGDKNAALEYFQRTLSEARKTGYKYGEIHRLGFLASLHSDLGKPDEAIRYCDEALVIAKKSGMLIEQEACLRILGDAYLRKGMLEKTLALCQQAIDIIDSTGNLGDKASSLLTYGLARHLLGELDKARRCYENALALNIPLNNYRVSVKLGIIYLQQGDKSTAKTNFYQALELCQDALEKSPTFYDAVYNLSISLLCIGEKDKAIENYRRALEVCSAKGVIQNELLSLQLLKRIANPPDGLQEAITLLEKAILGSS